MPAGTPGQSSADANSPAQGSRSSSFPTAGASGSQSRAEQQASSSSTSSRSPGQNAGSQSRQPGAQAGAAGSRDSSTSGANSGNASASGSTSGAPSGDYSLDTLPDGVLSGNGAKQTASATATPAERVAVLDEELHRGYETFDGFILSERERAQAESNAAGSSAPGGQSGGGGADAAEPQTMPESGAASGAVLAGQPAVSTPAEPSQTFTPPEDIPSGRDDDVVARQLREAAMSEPDPVLREALWDEYRNYTGLSSEEQ